MLTEITSDKIHRVSLIFVWLSIYLILVFCVVADGLCNYTINSVIMFPYCF